MKFSVAKIINIEIDTSGMTRKTKEFLTKIYSSFDCYLDDCSISINLKFGEYSETLINPIQLGKDAFICRNKAIAVLSSGHVFKREANHIDVIVPKSVKRGRIPFKRTTPGRHITDEILEPLLVFLSKELGIQFLHASSFAVDGKANVLLAWRSTGKTKSILPKLLSEDVISDDLTIIDNNNLVHKYPRPVRVYSYNLDDLPHDDSFVKKLKLKSKVTPSWQPVEYLSLKPAHSVYHLEKVTFLNNSEARDQEELFRLAELITKFEYAYFEQTAQILKLAKVIV